MYLGKNPSALRSRTLIEAALVALLDEEPYGRITVKTICERAGVSRQTFYQMFDSKDEVVEYHFAVLFAEFRRRSGGFGDMSLRELACSFFTFFGEWSWFVVVLVDNGMYRLLEREFERYLPLIRQFRELNESEAHPDYSASFVAGALCQVLVHWIERGMDLSVEELSAIVEGSLRGDAFGAWT